MVKEDKRASRIGRDLNVRPSGRASDSLTTPPGRPPSSLTPPPPPPPPPPSPVRIGRDLNVRPSGRASDSLTTPPGRPPSSLTPPPPPHPPPPPPPHPPHHVMLPIQPIPQRAAVMSPVACSRSTDSPLRDLNALRTLREHLAYAFFVSAPAECLYGVTIALCRNKTRQTQIKSPNRLLWCIDM